MGSKDVSAQAQKVFGLVFLVVSVATVFSQGGPTIIQQPVSQSATNGSEVFFTVNTGGTLPLVYKWVHIHGASQDTLIRDTLSTLMDTLNLRSFVVIDTGSYKVVITNSTGVAVSVAAKLTATSGPPILSQPSNVSTLVGGTAKFSIAMGGSVPMIYEWISGTTDTLKRDTLSILTDTLQLSSVTASEGGSYKVLVKNSSGVAVSISANLTVTPLGILRLAGTSSAFSAQAIGASVDFQFPQGMVGKVQIIDLQGHVLWSHAVDPSLSKFRWDGSISGGFASPGIYVCRLIDALQGAKVLAQFEINLVR